MDSNNLESVIFEMRKDDFKKFKEECGLSKAYSDLKEK